MEMETVAVILAAGQGKRMRSARSKVLFALAGRALLDYSLRAAAGQAAVTRQIVVTSPDNCDAIGKHLAGQPRVSLAVQQTPRGTGDAVCAALDQLDAAWTLILCGDTPLVRTEDLEPLFAAREHSQCKLFLLSAELEDPTGYGRVIKQGERVLGIREQRDLTEPQQAISEANAGIYLVETALLKDALATLTPDNDQGELYLTDIVAFAAERAGAKRGAIAIKGDPRTLVGVNDRAQLNAVADEMYARIASRHRAGGVTVHSGAQIDDTVEIALDVEVGFGVALRGRTKIGEGSVVDNGCVITDSVIGEKVKLLPYSVVTESEVGNVVQIGPFAHLRPGSIIEAEAKVGNFVETKKTRMRRGAKANHLSYLGDGDVGEGANLGAGTIFCNYDGYSKSKTVIGREAFVGSDSQLVAPVTVGEGSFVASGTTVVVDVPPNSLALSRSEQVNKEGYAPKLRQKLEGRALEKRQQKG
jgi:bifunctional UDP-N-acetylglucosamine pyrophosphorylase / glucosamine-1-phosphate N-acetyltransferase